MLFWLYLLSWREGSVHVRELLFRRRRQRRLRRLDWWERESFCVWSVAAELDAVDVHPDFCSLTEVVVVFVWNRHEDVVRERVVEVLWDAAEGRRCGYR